MKTSAEPLDKSPVSMEAAMSFLAAIIASSDDAIFSRDLNGTISSWNEGASRIFGYGADEIIGQPVLRLIPEELHHEEGFSLSRIRAGERIDHFETVRVKKNGERFPVSITISPVATDGGGIIGAAIVARDISDRQSADENRLRLAAIVDSADDAIISKNLDGIITSWNRGAQRLFGYKAEEIIGRSILRLIPEDLYREEDEILRKLRAGEKIEHYETTRIDKSGEPREVSVTISPVRNGRGEVIGASKIARDISDRKKIERLVIQAENIATTGRMAAAIAHEINNPLSAVLNLVFLARQDGVSAPEVQRYLATAEGELVRVAYIARRTLGFYRDTTSPSEVHLGELMENVLAVYRSRILGHGIAVDTSYDDTQKITVRPGEIVQIFSNIVSNAIDAMQQGGRLAISMTRTRMAGRDGVRIAVSDTGPGIQLENLDKIFEPFFTTKGNLGTGIGLWVVRQLVDRHGGQIAISSSTEPGASGTLVTIDLPFDGLEGRTERAAVPN